MFFLEVFLLSLIVIFGALIGGVFGRAAMRLLLDKEDADLEGFSGGFGSVFGCLSAAASALFFIFTPPPSIVSDLLITLALAMLGSLLVPISIVVYAIFAALFKWIGKRRKTF